MEDLLPADLERKLRTKNAGIVLVDVREVYEHKEAHIRGAINIPLGAIPEQLNNLKKYRKKELVMHCNTGARGAGAKAFLKNVGFKRVRNLKGGLKAWKQHVS